MKAYVYSNFVDWGADVVGKRIDSTVRGNLGVETDALLEAMGENSVAVVVASYPDSGRIVSGGYLLVMVCQSGNGCCKGSYESNYNSYVPTIMTEQSQFRIGHIGLGNVLKGKNSIHLEI